MQNLELIQEKAELVGKLRSLIDKAEEARRDLSEDEDAEYLRLDKRLTQVVKLIERSEKLGEFEEDRKRIVNPLNPMLIGGNGNGHQETRDEFGFENMAEMLWAIKELKNGRHDERLEKAREKREQTMGQGSQGGFAVSSQFISSVFEASQQQGIVRKFATVIPAGDPPDSELLAPTLDQTAGENNFGGVTIAHGGEGVTLTETDLALRQISLTPKQLNAYVVVSNKLLRNWSEANVFITGMLRKAMAAAEDRDFMLGDGVNKSIGFINSPAAVLHSRAGANAVAFADVYNMVAKAKQGGNLIWIGSQTIIPQLAAMVDAGTHAVWLGSKADALSSAAGPLPSSLFGYNLYFADRLPALGTKGDLNLVDLSYYLIKDGSMEISMSDQLFYLTDRSVFRIIWNVDAKPWLTEPLRLEGDTTQQISPFVVLSDV